jgi:hypothetical protein
MKIDASGNVGIGTSSPSSFSGDGDNLVVGTTSGNNGISIISATDGSGNLYFGDTATTGGGSRRGQLVYDHSSDAMSFATAVTERMRIDSSGNVKIGDATTDVTSKLTVSGNASASLATFMYDGAAGTYFDIDCNAAGGSVNLKADARTGAYPPLLFTTGGSESMRLDASGNLLVGTTDSATYNFTSGGGTAIWENGLVAAAKSGATVGIFNRTTSDGDIVQFRKDGTTVGSIQSRAGAVTTIVLDPRSNGAGISGSSNAILPTNEAGNPQNNLVSVGTSTNNFKDLYLSGQTIVDGGAASAPSYSFAGDTNTGISRPTSDAVNIVTGGNERLRVNSSGDLLVGKTAVSGSTAGIQMKPAGELSVVRDGNHALILNRLSSDGSLALFQQASTTVGSISVTSSATAYNTSSDQRLKENIVDAPSASDDIDAIQVRSFDWKVDGSHQKYGMVAQELQTVAPEAVSAPKDPEEMMGVDYSKLVPMMLKEIQSLRARVAQLES